VIVVVLGEEVRVVDQPHRLVQARVQSGPAPVSFRTHLQPRDVDCVLLMKPHGQGDRTALRELRTGLPFLDIAVVRTRAFDEYVHSVFAADRTGVAKGMVEVIQRT
jgi:hypothetical protein